MSGSKHVCLFRDNALSHIYNYVNKLVNFFLKLEKVTVLTHPPYSLNLVPCDLLLFIKRIHFWSGHCYKSRRPPVKARPPVRALELYINKLTATWFRKKKDSEIEIMYFEPGRLWRNVMFILLLEWNAFEILYPII